MKLRLPIGITNFKEIISENYYFIDKSLFIEEVLEDGAKVILLPRPRRFGKTLNLSMLKYFLEKTKSNNAHLFTNLAISKNKKLMKRQGQYPVIFMTLKDVKVETWSECVEEMRGIIEEEYTLREYLLKSDKLTQTDIRYFKSILNASATNIQYTRALKNLSKYLHNHHGKRPFILIDEYDTPIQEGFLNNYQEKIIGFMRNLLSGAFKDNVNLEKGIITGILRISKENIFSGLNNLEVCGILDQAYSDKFGLLEHEVKETLKYYDVENKTEKIKSWYNGYMFDENLVYNPWSIINLIKKQCRFAPYWVNTSQNTMINELIAKGMNELKEDFELLISGKTIDKIIDEDIVLNKVRQNPDAVWNLLLFSGYLTYNKKWREKRQLKCSLKIPNEEVVYIFEKIIRGWFNDNIGSKKYDLMLKNLTNGNVESFTKTFQEFLINSISYFDPAGNDPEKVYHAFVLGMLIGLQDSYEVKSNREGGDGRYDVTLFPKEKNGLGIVFEFKVAEKKENLNKTAQKALQQIEKKKYAQELTSRGIKKKLLIGMAFRIKEMEVKHKFI